MPINPARALVRIQNPVSEPISLAEAKLYLRVDGSDDDIAIAALIGAVREKAEEYLRKSLVRQRWKLTYEDYAPLCVPLPRGPVLEILSVKRRDRDGGETVIGEGSYRLNARADMLRFESAILAPEIEIVYETGYGESEEVPSSIRQGMLVHLAALYEKRDEGTGLPPAAVCLYKHHCEIKL
jgi:uncharacterized phiE125 gp8 family phage protein